MKTKILKLTKADEGQYECNIGNSKAKNKNIKKLVKIVMEIEPKHLTLSFKQDGVPKVIEKELLVRKYADIELNCLPNGGFPVPTINWFKDDEKIDGSSLKLRKSDLAKHVGRYECVVENIKGKKSASFQLKLQLGPQRKSKSPQFIETEVAKEISLKCDISGSPEPKISWMRNGANLEKSKIYETSRDGKTLFFQFQKFLAGNYSCLGSNQFGSVSIDFVVFGRAPPKIINSNTEYVDTAFEAPLELFCDATGIPQVEI